MSEFVFHARPPRLIGLPYDASSSYMRGPREAPPLIREALNSSAGNSFTELLDPLNGARGLTDEGDLQIPDDASFVDVIETGISTLIASGFSPVSLGGDHAVTYPILRAVNSSRAPLTIVHIDAHPDLYDSFDGDKFSHACPFARIMESQLASRLVQVGIRTMNPHQREQANRFGVEVIDMRAWYAEQRFVVDGPLYMSIDMDAMDPAFAPGVSHREPGGLSVREVIDMIQMTGGKLIGADVVEYNPRHDTHGVTATVAAKLVKELAGRIIRDSFHEWS